VCKIIDFDDAYHNNVDFVFVGNAVAILIKLSERLSMIESFIHSKHTYTGIQVFYENSLTYSVQSVSERSHTLAFLALWCHPLRLFSIFVSIKIVICIGFSSFSDTKAM
jgi:hypothetical protein